MRAGLGAARRSARGNGADTGRLATARAAAVRCRARAARPRARRAGRDRAAARLRRASGVAHRVVVRHRRARACRASPSRFGFQVTFFRTRSDVAADHPSALRRAPAAVRARRADRPAGGPAAPRPAHRARRLRHRRGERGRHRPAPARLDAAPRGRGAGRPPLPRARHGAGVRASTSRSPPRSRCCCRATPACRARGRTRRTRAAT